MRIRKDLAALGVTGLIVAAPIATAVTANAATTSHPAVQTAVTTSHPAVHVAVTTPTPPPAQHVNTGTNNDNSGLWGLFGLLGLGGLAGLIKRKAPKTDTTRDRQVPSQTHYTEGAGSTRVTNQGQQTGNRVHH